MKRSLIFGAIVAIAVGVIALTSGTATSSRPTDDANSANTYVQPFGPNAGGLNIVPPQKAN
jgi:hypothetical protein